MLGYQHLTVISYYITLNINYIIKFTKTVSMEQLVLSLLLWSGRNHISSHMLPKKKNSFLYLLEHGGHKIIDFILISVYMILTVYIIMLSGESFRSYREQSNHHR